MRAVIMAGGKGTRLSSIAQDIPKPMIAMNGKPILEYQIENLKSCGVTEVTLIVGYLGNVIRDYFTDGSKWGIAIDYITEEVPLGTAGALYYLKERINEDFFLVFGDLMLNVNWMRFMEFHKAHAGAITLFAHPNTHPYDSDVIVIGDNARVTTILPKNEERQDVYNNIVNAGLYCLSPRVFDVIDAPKKIDFEKVVLRHFIEENKVYAYRSTEYVKDIGTPERYEKTTQDLLNGVVTGRNLFLPQKAVFLDRDGTINVYRRFLNRAEQFELLPHAAEAIAKLNASKYLVIVATNQPVIARGECSYEELNRIHRTMETQLGKEGAYIDGLYFCPHHPDSGFPGEIRELKIACDCRKPGIGMLKKAEQDYHIDLSQSWFIGDTTMDIQTGIHAGMHTVLVKTGEAGNDKKYDVTPDLTAEDLLDAVNRILE